MIAANVKFEDKSKAVTDAAKTATFKNVGHAAASVRKTAQASIQKAPPAARVSSKKKGGKFIRRARHAAAPPGHAPFTQRGQFRRAILYAVDKAAGEAVIGPAFSVIGLVGKAHEFGGDYKGETFPERPTMGPALQKNTDRFASSFSGSIGPP